MKEMFHGCIHLYSLLESNNETLQQCNYQSNKIYPDTYSSSLEDIKK